jgi:hypothetical protein
VKKRHAEEQIIGVLNEVEAGMPVSDLLRKHNISQGTFYRWKAIVWRYGRQRGPAAEGAAPA